MALQTPRNMYILAYVFLCIALVVGVYFSSLNSGLDQLSQTGRVRIDQSSDRLLGQLSSFKQLPNILARHPVVAQVFDDPTNTEDVSDLLSNSSYLSGAREIFVLDKAGQIKVSSQATNSANPLFAKQPFVRAAMNGRLGIYTAIDETSGMRTIFIARGIYTDQSAPQGAVVIAVDIAELEFEWNVDEEALAFFDENDVAFVTNRTNLAMRSVGATEVPAANKTRYGKAPIQPFFGHKEHQQFGKALWRFSDTAELPSEALVVSKFIPRLDMTSRVFLPTDTIKFAAKLQAALVASLLFALGMVFWALWQRRQRLADLLSAKEEANATLEARVDKRTEQLKQAQYQLVQAGKLNALGEMSAGISHELNQPLAAMQNFAENGSKMLDRNRVDDARRNFGLIGEQIDRATRIIRSLRAFARKEKEVIEPVELQDILKESLNLAQSRLAQEGVTFVPASDNASALVMGGHVRLQQVILNLMTNAIDAMSGSTEKKIEFELLRTNKSINLIIRDTGNGLEHPERVFEPFYSTKDIGASKGMGLGLSISYGIIGSFGGDMTCRNSPDGGAEFTITLRKPDT